MNRTFRVRLQRKIEHGFATAGEAVGVARLKQDGGSIGVVFRHLLQRSDVVENVETASVGRDYEVMESFLYHSPSDRSVRQACIQRPPVASVVERIEEVIAGTCEK